MAYLVNLTARAQRDLVDIYEYIHAADSAAASRWYAGLKEAILSLEEFPYRCPETPEKQNVRHLLYGRKPRVHLVFYRISEKKKRVDIVHIRHGARQRPARRRST